MNEPFDVDLHPDTPSELRDLPRSVEPPAELEDRVTRELMRRGLVGGGTGYRSDGPAVLRASRRRQRSWLAAAAALLLGLGSVLGFALGRGFTPAPNAGGATAIPGAQYALLLYETDGFERATGAESVVRFEEYSQWVAEARSRQQFITGEDLEVDQGWVMTPSPDGIEAAPGAAAEQAPLSGIFLITARDDEHAMALAESLPHLQHGGQVVIQRVIPTDQPPAVED